MVNTKMRRALATTAAICALLLAPAALADASGGHMHAADRGTPEAPVSIVRLPTDLPGPIAARGPQKVIVDLETSEVYGQLDGDTAYHYWTFNGKVPGPSCACASATPSRCGSPTPTTRS